MMVHGHCFFYDTLDSELCQHLLHMLINLLRIVIWKGTDVTESTRNQYPTMDHIGLVLPVLFILLMRKNKIISSGVIRD